MNSVEQRFFRESIASRVASRRAGQSITGSGKVVFVNVVTSFFFGKPSCRTARSMSITTTPWQSTTYLPESVNLPITVASTSRCAASSMNAPILSGGTARVIRSCNSEIQISHGAMPGYFSGTASSVTWQPLHSFAISATEQESPPALLSVMLRYNPRSRASFTITSENFFWVIGSPIWTAVTGLAGSSASEENVSHHESRGTIPRHLIPGIRLCSRAPGTLGEQDSLRAHNYHSFYSKSPAERQMYSVLYVDNEADFLERGRIHLEQSGDFRVDTCVSATGALEKIRNTTYDAIVSGYQMPGMDGIEFLKQVRSEYGGIPFILFTGKGGEEVILEAIDNGADFSIRKGGSTDAWFAELGHRIRSAVGRSRSEEQRRSLEAAVRESGERYRLIMENANDGILVNELTPEGPGKFIDANDRACRILGMTRDEMQGVSLTDLDTPEMRQRAPEVFREIIRKNHLVFQTNYRTKDNREKTLEISVSLFDLNGRRTMQSAVRDVTERRQMEEALQRQNRTLATINALAAELAALPYNESIQKRVLGSLREISGAGATWFCDYDPNDQTLVLGDIETTPEILKKVAAAAGIRPGSVRSPVNKEIFREITGTIVGKRRTLTEISFGAIPPPVGALVQKIAGIDRFIGIGYVIGGDLYGTSVMGMRAGDPDPPTELLEAFAHIVAISLRRRNAETALRESEEKFRSIIENMQDIYYRTDTKGMLVMISPSAAKILGFDSPDDLIGKKIADTLYPSPGDRDLFMSEMDRNSSVQNWIVTLKKRDGTPFIVSANSQFYYDKSGKNLGVEGILHDINEITKTKNALSQANKKLGLLSGITRHDVLNKLTVLISHLNLMKRKTEDPYLLSHIAKAKNAGAGIRQQIEFTRLYQGLGLHEPQWEDVKRIVSTLQIPPGITLAAPVHCVEILADPLLIKVFENLLDNAVRHGKKVTTVRVTSRESDSGLTITFEDDGIGIPAEDKEQIFERGYGKNTGLGLFLVREILAITGMKISETGIPGTGARFEITVPKGAYRITGYPVD